MFFNQNRSAALRDDAVREALSVVVDREEIIADMLFTQGVPITAPIAIASSTIESNDDSEESPLDNVATAKQLLADAGWQTNSRLLEKEIDGTAETLTLTPRTSNARCCG